MRLQSVSTDQMTDHFDGFGIAMRGNTGHCMMHIPLCETPASAPMEILPISSSVLDAYVPGTGMYRLHLVHGKTA